jgi:hypothetical protein
MRRTEEARYTILDWRPFEYFTIETMSAVGQKQLTSYCLRSTTEGSRIIIYWKNGIQVSPADLSSFEKSYHDSLSKLHAMIAHDLTSGKIVNTLSLSQQ